LTENQIFFAQKYFMAKFIGLNDREMRKKYNQFRVRIFMVNAWLIKDKARYIPLPSKYFDPDNQKGFSGTKAWYNEMLKKEKQVEDFKSTHRKELVKFQKFKNNHAASMQLGQAFINSNATYETTTPLTALQVDSFISGQF